ncbi:MULTISPECIES: DUF6035 family protein [Methylobacter]
MSAYHKFDPNQNQPWLVCSLCGAAVQLVCLNDKNRTFYFRHNPEEEDRGCPVSTKGQYSADQINAMKYNGAKESLAHQHLKELLRKSILADASFESPPKVERVWKAMDRKAWRKPDVQATSKDYKLAFEIQLSTTFLSTIVDRRDFYRAENGYLLWIFQKFNPSRTRRSEEDIFYNNNSNIFIVSQHTLERSKEYSRLALECWYPIPQLHNGQICDEWQHQYVFIDELIFDQTTQQIYFYDYEAERANLEQSLIAERTRLEQKLIDEQYAEIRESFINFWKKHGGISSKAGHNEWKVLRATFKTRGVELPEFYDSTPFNGVISIILSAKYGYPVGYSVNTLIEVTNPAFNHYKSYLYIFGKTLNLYGHAEILKVQDTKGTWKRRTETIYRAMFENKEAEKNWQVIPHPEYIRERQFDNLILFLLPELKMHLNKS